jgi:hypothetical protein
LTQAPRQGLHSIAEGLRHAITFRVDDRNIVEPGAIKRMPRLPPH